jgi:hypothetical protein
MPGADPNDIAHFGRTPVVRVRLHNEPTNGSELWPERAGNALRSFYGQLDSVPELDDWPPIPEAYEQWVTLETPSGRLQTEAIDDPAYAFHRALGALNWFLTALDMALGDLSIRAISTRELGGVVFRGALTRTGSWMRLGDLLMHPDSFPAFVKPQPIEAVRKQLDSAIGDLQGGRLFLVSNLWHSRALRAFHFRGDHADCVVSLQTATESMMYDLLRGLMVDAGKTAAEIASVVNADLRYKSLLNRDLTTQLGGRWDLTDGHPVGRYWQSVYVVRNQVVHGGYTPGPLETEAAMQAFLNVREYVSERLWRRYPQYPRTLLAKVGVNGLDRRGWLTKAVRRHCQQFGAEPSPFYWPKDIAGR